MGCSLYTRINNFYHPIEIFFLHSDSQGQYGENSNDLPYLENFCKGYQNKVSDCIIP